MIPFLQILTPHKITPRAIHVWDGDHTITLHQDDYTHTITLVST